MKCYIFFDTQYVDMLKKIEHFILYKNLLILKCLKDNRKIYFFKMRKLHNKATLFLIISENIFVY